MTSPSILHAGNPEISAVVVCVGAGSRFEPRRLNGMAHLLEHAAFLGAGDRDYRSIRATIDRLGGDVSAETNEEMLMYWGRVNDARDFSECLDLVADLVLAPRLEQGALRREIGTVVQEISGAGDDVFQAVVEMTKKLLWPGDPIGWPVGGTTRSVLSISADQCQAYWRQTHQGERMTILVVGTAAESRQARKRFGAAVGVAGQAVHRTMEQPPRRSAQRHATRRFRGKHMSGNFARLCLGLPGLAWGHPQVPALHLLCDMLGRDETSRLWERIRGAGLSYCTESFFDCFADTGWLGLTTDAPADATGEVVRIACEEVAGFAEGFTSDELEQARTGHIARLRDEEQTAPLEWVKYQATCAHFEGRVPTVEQTVAEIRLVTRQQLQDVARELLRPERLVLGAGGPRRALRDAEIAFREAVG